MNNDIQFNNNEQHFVEGTKERNTKIHIVWKLLKEV